MELKFKKVREVLSPTRGDGSDGDLSAGIDFYVPKINSDFISDFYVKNEFSNEARIVRSDTGGIVIHLAPFCKCLIPTGLKLNLQSMDGVLYDDKHGVALIAFNRGSVGSSGIVHGACVVDEDYQGELFMSIINTTDEPRIFKSDFKLLQFILIPILRPTLVEVSDTDSLFPTESSRGDGALGSTNK